MGGCIEDQRSCGFGCGRSWLKSAKEEGRLEQNRSVRFCASVFNLSHQITCSTPEVKWDREMGVQVNEELEMIKAIIVHFIHCSSAFAFVFKR